MINQKLQPKPKVDLPEQAKVGDVLTLTGSIVNAFSGLYLLHFWKGDNDAPFISGFDVVDWETISFVVPNKVGQVTVTGIYALSSSLPEEVQFLASLTIESA